MPSAIEQQGYVTFEDYCRERWKMSRIHAHRMIEASEVAGNLLPVGNVPKTESQAREHELLCMSRISVSRLKRAGKSSYPQSLVTSAASCINRAVEVRILTSEI